MTDDPKQGEPEKQSPVQPDQAEQDQDQQGEEADGGRKPPPDDLTEDPAYNPDGPLKGIKGG